MAITLLKLHGSPAKAATVLAEQCEISKRQAYRYVKDAQQQGTELPIPDPKIAFTVKIPRNLIRALRRHARVKGQTISEVVTQALETFIYKGQGRGKGSQSQD